MANKSKASDWRMTGKWMTERSTRKSEGRFKKSDKKSKLLLKECRRNGDNDRAIRAKYKSKRSARKHHIKERISESMNEWSLSKRMDGCSGAKAKKDLSSPKRRRENDRIMPIKSAEQCECKTKVLETSDEERVSDAENECCHVSKECGAKN